MTENNEELQGPTAEDVEREPRSRKTKKLRRYKYPKTPPKGTFSTTVARAQKEETSSSWPLSPALPPDKRSDLPESPLRPSITKVTKDARLFALEQALEKELDRSAETSREEERARLEESFERHRCCRCQSSG